MHEQEAYRNLRHNVKINTIQGIYSVMANNLIIPFLPLFAIKVLEASDSQVAWVTSLPALTGILVLLPGALFIDRLAAKKRFTTDELHHRTQLIPMMKQRSFLHSSYWMQTLGRTTNTKSML